MADRTEIPDLQGLIKDNIAGKVTEQHVQSLLPPGENYGSVIYKVDFKVKQDDGKEKDYHAVAKCTPPNQVTQELFNTQATFKSEIGWYTTVIPTYKQFQKDQGVDKEIDFFQKFYGARISLDPESDRVDLDAVILTENLKVLGYKNEDRHVGFDLPTTQSVINDLAAFHAIPVAIKQKNPKLFDEKVIPYLGLLNINIEETRGAYKELLVIFDEIPSCQPFRERIEKNIEQTKPFTSDTREGPWQTIVHNDFWVNNIMISDDEHPKTIILDLQIPSLGSPASDLIFLLFTSVNLEVVRDRIDYFLRYYFDQFISQLKALGASTDQFVYDAFLKEVGEEVKISQYTHALGHNKLILDVKGQAAFDSSDANFKKDDLKKKRELKFNDRHKEKFEWITLEAAKRNWI